MKGKLPVTLLVIAVAAAAFFLGWMYSTQPAAETAALPPATEPAAAVSQPPPPVPAPTETARPARRAEAQPQSSSPAAAAPAAATTTPATAPAAAAPPAAPEPVKVRLAEGTKITFALNDSLSTKSNRPGDSFSGVVTRSVTVGGTIAIPEGTVVRGTVAHVERPGRVKGRGELGLSFDKLEFPDGQVYDLSASLTGLDEGEKESVTEEGQVKSEGSKKRDVSTIGAGAGIGAVIGAIAGGGKGAATGGAIGAGAGTAMVLLTRGKDVELKRGTELAIQLDRPLAVTIK